MGPRMRTVVLVLALAWLHAACGSSGGSSPTTASSGGSTTGSGGPGGGGGTGSGGDGGSGGGGGGTGGSGGGSGISLSAVHFRTLTVSVRPVQGGTVSDSFAAQGSAVQDCTACRELYRIDTRVTLTAEAAPGFAFDHWGSGPCAGSASPVCSFTIDADREVTALFR